MKPRHAAALTLIGWYLLVPPLESVQLRPGPGKDEDTLDWKTPSHPPPLSAWSIEGSYDTARECREAKREETDPVPLAWGFAKCIATDDPRLKEK